MGDYELVIGRCKRLEKLLEDRFGASGRGLHEKTSSVEGKLPPELVKRLRFIATVRNKLVHEDAGNRIDDAKGYKKACDWAESEIKRLMKGEGRGCFTWVVIFVLIVVVVGLGWWLLK